MRKAPALIPLLCVILAASGAAQKRAAVAKAPAPASHHLLALKVTGNTRYTDTEILAAIGLRLGQDVAEGDFKEAAQRLGESGFFSDVIYSFAYSDAGYKLNLRLTDDPKIKLVPAHFDNLVWFTDPELFAALRQRVPLFKQLLPVGGRFPNQVSQALQALLNEKHLPGRVDFLLHGGQEGGDLTGIVFKVEEVSLKIRNLEFPGASPEQSAFLTAGVRKLVGVEYSRSALAAVAKFDLLPLYLQRGYLKAAFGFSDAHLAAEADSKAEGPVPADVEVDAIIPVMPGKVYTVSGVTWKGNSAVTSEEASHLFHLATDHPADAVRLVHDEENLTRLYRSRGYMTVQIKPDAQMDDEKSAVHYDMNITEGDLYRMGEVEIMGVDSATKDRLREAWTLREGEPYNADYIRKFLADAQRYLPREVQFSVKLAELLDAKSKVVDVTIHYRIQ